MKQLLHCLLIALLAGCQPQMPAPETYVTLAQCLNKAYQLGTEANYAEARNLVIEALRHLPTDGQPNDSLAKYTRNLVFEYFNLSSKLRDYPAASKQFDSLTMHAPLIDRCANYERTALRAHFCQMTGDNNRAVALADSFLLLPDPPEAERLMRYAEMASGIYYYCDRNTPRAIALLEKAVNAYQQGGTYQNMGRVFFRLAFYYRESDRYEEAARATEQSIDYYRFHADRQRGIALAYGEQSTLYQLLGMMDKALQVNALAAHYSQRDDSVGLGDIYRLRGDIFCDLHRYDSAAHYLRQAEAVSACQRSQKGVFYSKLLLADVALNTPDSVPVALASLRALSADREQTPAYFRSQLDFSYGKALLQTGSAEAAIPLLEESMHTAAQIGIAKIETEAGNLLMEAYRQAKRDQSALALFPHLLSLNDSLNHKERLRIVAATNIGYETRKKEQENQLLTAEVALKSTRLRSYTLLGVAALLAGLIIGSWFWMRQRALRLHLRLKEQEHQFAAIRLQQQEASLQQIIASRQALHNNNEELLRQLTEIQATQDAKGCDLGRVMESLQPCLLTNAEEEQFRNAFANLYPIALHRLRTTCPRATRTDELICMLIVLKQTNEEMARTLGISRQSVLQNRYRLRAKLGLPEKCDLDNEVRQILLSAAV